MAQGPETAAGDELVFMALGGIGEIGMNCYLYGLGPPDARKWLMIDLGITFPEGENDPGIDVILPDVRFIEEERGEPRRPRAHARARGPPRRGDRAVAAPQGADLRNSVHGGHAALQARRVRRQSAAADQGGVAQRPLPSRTVRRRARHRWRIPSPSPTRSPCARRSGVVLHTGDWKIDATPPSGRRRDEARLRQLGDRGRAGDDRAIPPTPCARADLALRARRRQVARGASSRGQAARRGDDLLPPTSRASRRWRTPHEGAGRQLVVAGRAMHRIIEVAMETGYLPQFQVSRPGPLLVSGAA